VVAFVPEGMLPLVTLALAIGTQRMAKHNALIKVPVVVVLLNTLPEIISRGNAWMYNGHLLRQNRCHSNRVPIDNTKAL
jgi:hypothetical protein